MSGTGSTIPACPECKLVLQETDDGLACPECGRSFQPEMDRPDSGPSRTQENEQ